MKKLNYFIVILSLLTILFSCGEDAETSILASGERDPIVAEKEDTTKEEDNSRDSIKVTEPEDSSKVDPKETKDTIVVKPIEPKIELPLSFTKRVLVEKLTGTWCGFCPDASQRIREVSEIVGEEKIVNISIHTSDDMAVTEGGSLYSALGRSSGVPAVAFDRFVFESRDTFVFGNRGNTTANVEDRLKEIPTCGISIDATGDSIIVYVGFLEEVSGDIAVTLFLLEDGILDDQTNGMDQYSPSDYYGMGNPITDFEHNHVLKDIVSNEILGDEVSPKKGSITRLAYSVNYDDVVKGNCSFVASVGIVGSGKKGHEVLNVNHVVIGNKVAWNE